MNIVKGLKMKVDYFELTETELQGHLNTAFINIVASMVKEGFLTEEHAADLQTNYFVVVESHSWLPKWVAEKLGHDKNKLKYTLSKRIQ